MPRSTLTGLGLVMAMVGPVAAGQTATWSDPAAIWWSDAAAWDPAGVPGAAHHVDVLAGVPVLRDPAGIMSLHVAAGATLVNADVLNVADLSTIDGEVLVAGRYTIDGLDGTGRVSLHGGALKAGAWPVHADPPSLRLVDGTIDVDTLWTIGGGADDPALTLHDGQHVRAAEFFGDDADVLRLEGGTLEIGPAVVSFQQPVYRLSRGTLRLTDALSTVQLADQLEGVTRLGDGASLWAAGDVNVGYDDVVIDGGALSVASLEGRLDYQRGTLEVRESGIDAGRNGISTLRTGDRLVASWVDGSLVVDGGQLVVARLDNRAWLRQGELKVVGPEVDLTRVLREDPDDWAPLLVQAGQVIDVAGLADAGDESLVLRGGVLRAQDIQVIPAKEFILESGELHIRDDFWLGELELLPDAGRLVDGQTLRVDGALSGQPRWQQDQPLLIDGGSLHAGTLQSDVELIRGELSIGGDWHGSHTLGKDAALRVGGLFSGTAALEGGMLEVGSLEESGSPYVTFRSGELIVHDDLDLHDRLFFEPNDPGLLDGDRIAVDGHLTSGWFDLRLNGGELSVGSLDGQIIFGHGRLAITAGDLADDQVQGIDYLPLMLAEDSAIQVSGRFGETQVRLDGGLLDVGQLAGDSLDPVTFDRGTLRVREQDVRLTRAQTLTAEHRLQVDRNLALEARLDLEGGTLAVGGLTGGANLVFSHGTLHWLDDFYDLPATVHDPFHQTLRHLAADQRVVIDGNLYALAGLPWTIDGGDLTAQRVIGAPLDFRSGRVELLAPGVVLGDSAGPLPLTSLGEGMTLALHQALRIGEDGFTLQGGHLIVDALTPDMLSRLNFASGELEVTGGFDATGFGEALSVHAAQSWTFGGHVRLPGAGYWRADLQARDLSITPLNGGQLVFEGVDVTVDDTLRIGPSARAGFSRGATLSSDIMEVSGVVTLIDPATRAEVRRIEVRIDEQDWHGRFAVVGATLTASEAVTVESGRAGLWSGLRVFGPNARVESPLIENDGWIEVLNGATVAGHLVNRGTLTVNVGTFEGDLTNEADGNTSLGGLTLDGSFVNHGDAGGEITLLSGSSITNYGTMSGIIDASQGTITNHGALGGDDIGEVEVTGLLTNHGQLRGALVTGTLQNMAGGDAADTDVVGSLTNAGTVTGFVNVTGDVANTGTLQLYHAAISGSLSNHGGAGLTNTSITGDLSNQRTVSVIDHLSIGGNVTNGAADASMYRAFLRADRHAQVEVGGNMTNHGEVLLHVEDGYGLGGRLHVTGDLHNGPYLYSHGSMPSAGFIGLGELLVDGNLTNEGSIEASPHIVVGGNLTNTVDGWIGGAVAVQGTLVNHGELDGAFDVGGSLTNTGDIDADGGITVTADVSNSGSISTADGLTVGGDLTNTAMGSISGDLDVAGNLYNDGVISPGNSPGVLRVGGDLIVGETGRIVLEIAGIGGEQDVIDVAGRIVLGGVLEIAFIDGFAPQEGQTFDLFGPGTTIEGEAEVQITGLLAGFEYDLAVDSSGQGLVLTALSDGVVPEPAAGTLVLLWALMMSGARWRAPAR